MRLDENYSIDPADVLKYYKLEKLVINNEQLISLCPFHKDTQRSFSMSRSKGIWQCFGCGEKGDLYTFVSKMEGIFRWQAILLVREMASRTTIKPIKKITPQIEEIKILSDSILQNYRFRHKWLYREGFKENILREWEIGFSKKEWAITIPVRNQFNQLVGIIYRKMKGEPRYKYMKDFRKSLFLFGSNKLESKDGIIVEGSLDVVWLYQWGYRNTVAIMGNLISDKQAELMTQYFDCITLCLDNDDGGTRGTKKIIEKLSKKIPIYLTKLPSNRKDIRECSEKEIKEIFSNRINYFKVKLDKIKKDEK